MPHNIIYGIANIVGFLIKEKRKKGFRIVNLLILLQLIVSNTLNVDFLYLRTSAKKDYFEIFCFLRK